MTEPSARADNLLQEEITQKMQVGIRIGIDASNIGGGGGITHLREILDNFDAIYFHKRISQIVVFSSRSVLNQLPEKKILRKVTFPALNKKLVNRVIFQLTKYDKEIEKRCDLLFSVTGDYIGNFKPVVGMSRNMLLYDKEVWGQIEQKKEILKFWLSYKRQKKCFKNAIGVIFISQYAKDEVSYKLRLKKPTTVVIPHGVAHKFVGDLQKQKYISSYSFAAPFRFLYVSTIHVYKHHPQVITAISKLRGLGYPVELNLVGGIIFDPAGKELHNSLQKEDPKGEFIHYKGQINYTEIQKEYGKADGIIFASTCENMPNTLIESMASGLPIACSNKQPMPEFLKGNGFYFDAKDPESIFGALKALLNSPREREQLIKKNKKEIERYSWSKTSRETFDYLLSFEISKPNS